MTNVAVVVLDTLRKDAFDRHFDWLPGRRFERAYTTANWTVPAHASLFTGRYASEVGTHSKNMHLDCEQPVLAEQLQDVDYTTRAFSANTNVTGHFNFDRGFVDFEVPKTVAHLADDDLFDWREFTRTTTTTGLEKYLRAIYQCIRSDTSTLPSLVSGMRAFRGDNDNFGTKYGGLLEAQSALEQMSFADSEFLFLNLMEAHEPYRVPEEYQTVEEPPLTDSIGDITLDGVESTQVQQAYDDCARYLSNAYRELFETLREDFEYVITLADHGELLGEDDAWGHEHGVRPELTHVPLVVSGESLDGTCEHAVSVLDVHATILDIANVENHGRGESLLADPDGGESLTEYHGLTSWSEEKLADNGYGDVIDRYDRSLRGYVSPAGGYGYEMFKEFVRTGLSNTDDPERRLEALVADLEVREVETDNDVPDDIKDRLEHLGYA